MVTHPWDFVKLMVSLNEGRDTKTIHLLFLIVLCTSMYNCILDRPFAGTLEIEVYLIHMKMKYHNLYDNPVKICVALSRSWSVHKAL